MSQDSVLTTALMVVGCLVMGGGVFALMHWLAKACGWAP